MRLLTVNELQMVSGGEGQCTPSDGGNDIGGVTDPDSLGSDLIVIYEALVAATSHVIERVADAT